MSLIGSLKAAGAQVQAVHQGFFTFLKARFPNSTIDHEILSVNERNAVALLVYFVKSSHILVVKQRRPAMISFLNPNGLLVEAVAGRFNPGEGRNAKELAVKEMLEETGLKISISDIEIISGPLASSPGMTDETITYALVFINDYAPEETDEIFGIESEDEQTQRVVISYLDLLANLDKIKDTKLYLLTLALKDRLKI